MNTAAAIALAVCATAAHADVVIQSRSYSATAGYSTWPDPAHLSYSNAVEINQLGMSGQRTVGFVTRDNINCTSTATPTQFSAYVRNSSSRSGTAPTITTTGQSSRTFVVFTVTDAATAMSLTYSGSAFPLASTADAPVTLTIRNLDTGEIVFDIYDHTPPLHAGLNGVEWNNQWWTTLLAPGNYLLSSEGRAGMQYGAGGGSQQSSGGGTLFFTASFATTAPSLAMVPTPSTTALLTLLPALTLRRRR